MPPEPLHDVLESLVRSLVALYRVTPVRVRIDIDEDPGNPLSWRVKEIIGGVMWPQQTMPTPPPTSPTKQIEENRDKKSGLDESTKAILHVLRKSKKPLTKTMMLEALEEAQRKGEINEYVSISESTVCRRLKELMDDGTLQNPEDVKPRGYRFSE